MTADLLLATGGSDCERLAEGLLAQPLNTLSSLAYVFVGGWIALQARRAAGGVFGLLVALTGVGSIAYHGWDGSGVGLAHDLSIVAVAAFIVWFEITHARAERRVAGYTVAIGALAIGLAANLLGRTGAPLCAPGSVVQWHAVWHVATAVALGAWAWGALLVWSLTPGIRRVRAQTSAEEVRWEGSTGKPRSSPAPARESVEA